MSFRAASSITASDPGRFAWDVPEGWEQGRGAFGGLVIGTLARAMGACEPDSTRRLRSISAELCGPMRAVATEIAVAVLRRGRGTTYLEARALQGGEVVARASALLAMARPAPGVAVAVPPPSLPAYETVFAPPIGDPPTPRFAKHYEFRPVGGLPFSAGEPVTAGWVRERAAAGPLDDADVIGLLDAWWPCALVAEPAPRAMATVTFTAELIAEPATLDGARPFAYRAHLAGAADGYSVELRHLWQGDRLVGLNQQVFAAL